MLSLEVEWLMGVCWAASGPADGLADWPVQPDRIFSALVASWGARGRAENERAALQWLEELPPPAVRHAPGRPRTTVTSFVPPNDPSVTDIAILPDRRRRQPRQFPACVLPAVPHLRVDWDVPAPAHKALDALQALARDTSYIGHSSSVVRCRFLADSEAAPPAMTAATRAGAYPGRLADLEALYARHVTGKPNARPDRLARRAVAMPVAGLPESVFGEQWIVLADAGETTADPRAAPAIAQALRQALMAAYPDPLPEWLSGHAPEGGPSRTPHLAIVPLLDVIGPYPSGRLLGLAMVLPRTVEHAWAQHTPDAFAASSWFDAALAKLERDDGTMRVWAGKGGSWTLRRVLVPALYNQDPASYAGGQAGSAGWTTVTPLVLDRYPTDGRVEQSAHARETVTTACRNIGLPAPAQVALHKHAAGSGLPPAWPEGGAPAWLNWARPGGLRQRPLVHATLRFDRPVRGPLLLGAGRFLGLGLCRPV